MARSAGTARAGRVQVAALLAAGWLLAAPAASAESDAACATAGRWLNPATGRSVAPDAVFADLDGRPVVLLGEAHDNVEHHRWQLFTMAALFGRDADLVIGFEMFPRRLQPELDRWVAGELDEKAFLEAVDWAQTWGYDAQLYLPLFHFARQNRIPVVALNVERSLVAKVGREGWQAVPEAEREGVSDPLAASDAYVDYLAEVYRYKLETREEGEGQEEEEDGEQPAFTTEDEDFRRFVEAQLTWDRAMAEALAAARRSDTGPQVVGIVGRGHVERRFGIPHQLADLGIEDAAVLLPVERAAACAALEEDIADRLFVVDSSVARGATPPRPRLGVRIEAADGGLRIIEVVDGSVAQSADLKQGDIVTSAAGVALERVAQLIEIVQRQAPGTWLPLTVLRDDDALDVVAKFPQGGE